MGMLAQQSNTVFLGQGVDEAGGTSMSATFRAVPLVKRLEMPVAEELQMGMAIGMAIEGYLPICVFPRWNFVLRAADQLVNHLDRLPLYSDGGYKPRVIIRTAVPSTSPFNPGPQHDDDFTGPFRRMLRTVKVITLNRPERIVGSYLWAARNQYSTIIVERTDEYRNERGKA